MSPSDSLPRLRCFWCRAPLGVDGQTVRRDLPLGSPCPHCGKRPLILEPIPEDER